MATAKTVATVKTLLATAALAAAHAAARLVAISATGIVLNGALLVALVPQMHHLAAGMGGVHALHGGGGGAMLWPLAVVILAIAYWPVTLILLGFGVVFPVLYFVLGQRAGLLAAARSIYRRHRRFFVDYPLAKLRARLAPGATATALALEVPAYVQRFDDMSPLLRRLFRRLARQADVAALLVAAAGTTDDAQIAELIDRQLTRALLSPKALVWKLGTVNLCAFVLCKELF